MVFIFTHLKLYKIIKNYIKQNKLSKEEINKIQEEKQEIFSHYLKLIH